MWVLVLLLLVLVVGAAVAVTLPRGRRHADEAATVRGRTAGRD